MKQWLISLAIVVSAVGVVSAVDDGPVTVPAPGPGATPAQPPEARYNEGFAHAKRRDWKAAEAAYRDALRGRAAFPEAWNGLGYVLRHQGRYEESVRAYHEATGADAFLQKPFHIAELIRTASLLALKPPA
jgi:tetratricopeptide (TPR) repeat protein